MVNQGKLFKNAPKCEECIRKLDLATLRFVYLPNKRVEEDDAKVSIFDKTIISDQFLFVGRNLRDYLQRYLIILIHVRRLIK